MLHAGFLLPCNKCIGNIFYQLHCLSDSVHGKGLLGELVEDPVGVGGLLASLQQEGVTAGYGQCGHLEVKKKQVFALLAI